MTDERTAADEDEAYEIGRRDGYEEAIQELDLATGGDGEFRGSTIPGRTVDVPAMKARILERLRNEGRLKRCTICGFIVDASFAAEKPTAGYTMAGRDTSRRGAHDAEGVKADE